jgi:hypothetical protein
LLTPVVLGEQASFPEFEPPVAAEAVDIRFDEVLPKAGETLVWCKSFLLSADPGVLADNVVAIEPLPGNLSVHHMHLHVCDDESASWTKHRNMYEDAGHQTPMTCLAPSWEAGSGCHGVAWTYLPGQQGLVFPEGVGLTIGDRPGDIRRVILEVRYNQAYLSEGVADRAGIRLWATKKAVVKHHVGLLSVGDPSSRFPRPLIPNRTGAMVALFCPPECTKKFVEPMNVFAFTSHGHLRATSVLTYIDFDPLSMNVPGLHLEPGRFEYGHHDFEPANFTLGLGASVKTMCVYDTSNDTQPVAFGAETSKEMCTQIFLYWPKQPTFTCGYYSEDLYWCGGGKNSLIPV